MPNRKVMIPNMMNSHWKILTQYCPDDSTERSAYLPSLQLALDVYNTRSNEVTEDKGERVSAEPYTCTQRLLRGAVP